MTLDDAIVVLQRRSRIKRELANAPRTSDVSRDAALSHAHEADAIDIVLAALAEKRCR